MSPTLVLVVCALQAGFTAAKTLTLGRRAPPQFDHGVNLPSTRPLVVGHRGSSGSLPEHTAFAYQQAVDEGADVIECDLTISRDLVLLCMHENWMNDTTNVAEVYPPERASSYFVADQLRVITDYFAVDFTLNELKSVVRTKQRFSFRDPNYNNQLEIATFDEFIFIAKAAGRPVGLHIETKDPQFINSRPVVIEAETSLEGLLIDALMRHGYNISDAREPVFIQSFNENSLRYFADQNVRLPLVMLLSVGSNVSDERLQQLKQFAYGIGPSKQMIVQTNARNQIVRRTDLVQRSHEIGLRVHPYTARNEHEYLPWDYRQDPQLEYLDFLGIGVDGLFTDFPLSYKNFLDSQYAACSSEKN